MIEENHWPGRDEWIASPKQDPEEASMHIQPQSSSWWFRLAQVDSQRPMGHFVLSVQRGLRLLLVFRNEAEWKKYVEMIILTNVCWVFNVSYWLGLLQYAWDCQPTWKTVDNSGCWNHNVNRFFDRCDVLVYIDAFLEAASLINSCLRRYQHSPRFII